MFVSSTTCAELIKLHGPLVRRLAAQFQRRSKVHTELEDLIQAGLIGLLKAARSSTLDKTRGNFAGYAYWWIKAEIQAAILRELPIYRPKGTGMPYRVYKAAEAIRATGREPEASELGVTQEQWDSWAMPSTVIPYEREVISEDRNPEEALAYAQEQRAARGRLYALPVRSRRVLEGLSSGVSRKAMAAREGLSEERVRQIRRDALAAIVA
jgi:RNA polymerase sigma factor for flagellar operon FliA